MFVRTASERDLDAIRALLVETWHAAYDGIYGAAKVTEITDEWHSIAALKRRLLQPNADFLVADDGERLGGMAYAAAEAGGKTVMLHQDGLHLITPQRFFTHGQAARGDRHVYASVQSRSEMGCAPDAIRHRLDAGFL